MVASKPQRSKLLIELRFLPANPEVGAYRTIVRGGTAGGRLQTIHPALCVWKEVRDNRVWVVSGSWQSKSPDSPQESPGKNTEVETWVSAQRDPLKTSDLFNCKIINVCYFKPLGLWSFVLATAGNNYFSVLGTELGV